MNTACIAAFLFAGLIGCAVPQSSADRHQTAVERQLVGTWRHSDGADRWRIVRRADGTFTSCRRVDTGGREPHVEQVTSSGRWSADAHAYRETYESVSNPKFAKLIGRTLR